MNKSSIGDGDECPAVDDNGAPAGHGKMYVFGKRQYCPHSGHDGNGGRRKPTLRWFPLWADKESAA